MKIKNIIFSSLGTLIFLFAFNFYTPNQALSSAGDKILGYAWNDAIGWISFNNCSTTSPSSCVGTNYGVTYVDNNAGAYIFSGYAWNDNVGWISFEPSDIASCNNGSPRLVASPGLLGPAKIISLGSNGCIDLSGVQIVGGGNNNFYGYAWNNTIGWIDFTGVGIGTQQVPSVSLTATPTSIFPNSNLNLTWTSQNLVGFTCVASNNASLLDWTGSKATSGTAVVNVGPGSVTKIYTITCTNSSTSQTVTSSATVSILSGTPIPWFDISVPYPASFVEGGANVSFDIPLTIYGNPTTKTLYTAIGTSDPALAGSTFSLLYNGVAVPQAQPDPNDTVNPYDPRFLSLNIGGSFVIRMTIPRDLVAGSGNHRVQVVTTDGAETHSTYFDVTPLAQVPSGVCTLNGVLQGSGSGSVSRSGSVSVRYNSPISYNVISCTVGGGGGTGGTGSPLIPSVSLNASPSITGENSNINISWTSQNLTGFTCAASNNASISGWTGSKATSGSTNVNVGSGTSTRTFTITCTNSSTSQTVTSSEDVSVVTGSGGGGAGGIGPGGGSVGVGVTGGDITGGVNASGLRLSAFPQVVDPNSTTLLRWDGENASNCVASTGFSSAAGGTAGATGVWTGGKSLSGVETVSIGSTSEMFTIECKTPSGKTVTASTIVGIKGVEPGLFIVTNPLTGRGGRLLWRFGTNILPAPFYKEE